MSFNDYSCQHFLTAEREVTYMKRKYSLSKKITEEQAAVALKEMSQITGFGSAEFTDGYEALIVTADDDKIAHIMNRSVNIFARVCDETKLSFDSFVYED